MNLIGAALGLAAPLIGAKAGIGKNTTNIQDFGTTSQYNPNAFNYGGRAGGANQQAGVYSQTATDAQGRQAAQANYQNADYNRTNANQSRAGQDQVAQMMLARANGSVPSIAQMQADRQMQQAAAAQASMAASARGPAGLALAQQGAANNTANAQGMISGQAQINAAQERQQAEQAAFGAYSGMRAGDYQGQGIDAQMAQYQAMLDQQQHGLNDTRSMGYDQLANNVQQAQLQAQQNQQNLLANSHQATQGQELTRGQANANRESQYYAQATGALQGGVDSMVGGGGGAPGGGASPIPPPTPVGSTGGVSSGGAGMNSNWAGGAPLPPPTGSDDRMKYGMAPLSIFGGGVSSMSGPSSGPGMASANQLGSDGSMNVMGSLQANNAAAMRYQNDPTGGMTGGGLLSDDRAKLEKAYLQGREHQAAASAPKQQGLGEEIVRSLSDFPDQALGVMAGPFTPGLVRALGGRSDEEQQPDRVTQQFAQGAAPIQFQYKPGMGPQGQRVGVRAQGMLTTPVTAPAVTQRQDGLLQIDPAQGLSTALAGVGHLSQKQLASDARMADIERRIQEWQNQAGVR